MAKVAWKVSMQCVLVKSPRKRLGTTLSNLSKLILEDKNFYQNQFKTLLKFIE